MSAMSVQTELRAVGVTNMVIHYRAGDRPGLTILTTDKSDLEVRLQDGRKVGMGACWPIYTNRYPVNTPVRVFVTGNASNLYKEKVRNMPDWYVLGTATDAKRYASRLVQGKERV